MKNRGHVDALRRLHRGPHRPRTVQTMHGPADLEGGYSTADPRSVRAYLDKHGLSVVWALLEHADRVAELEADSMPVTRIEQLKSDLATAQNRVAELGADKAMSRSHVVYATLLDTVKSSDDELAAMRKRWAELEKQAACHHSGDAATLIDSGPDRLVQCSQCGWVAGRLDAAGKLVPVTPPTGSDGGSNG